MAIKDSYTPVKTNTAGLVTPSKVINTPAKTVAAPVATRPVKESTAPQPKATTVTKPTTVVAKKTTTPTSPTVAYDPLSSFKNTSPTETVVDTSTNKTVVNVIDNGDGTSTIIYSDGTRETVGDVKSTPTVSSTYTDADGNRIAVMSDGTTRNLGKVANDTKDVNAITNLTSLFTSYGLGAEIATAISELVKKGYDADTISLIAQDPKSTNPLSIAYQKRFAGNAGRIKLGLAPFDPATYLNVEKQFSEAVKQAGLPAGFYDTQADWANWIGAGVAPAEATRRVNLASDVLINKDPSYLDQMQNLYGLDKSHALAYLLDSNKALPLIEKQVNAVKFAAAAERAGVGVNKTLAEQYADLGITEATANKGFQSIAGSLAERQRLAEMEGIDAGSIGNKLVSATFAGGSPDIGGAAASEIGRFSGSAGAGKGTLGVEQTGIL